MTKRVGNIVVIEREEPAKCEYCGAFRELRPYGKDGARICNPCGNKPENYLETVRRYMALLNGDVQ